MSEGDNWRHFSHDADVGVQGFGSTVESAFQNAALALTAIVMDPREVRPLEEISVECTAPDHELLLYEWLNRIIYEMDVRRMIFGRYDVKIDGDRLTAVLRGEPMDNKKQDLAVDLKGATFTELKAAQENGRWVAQCVIDV